MAASDALVARAQPPIAGAQSPSTSAAGVAVVLGEARGHAAPPMGGEPPVLRALPVPPLHAGPVATALGLRYRDTAGVQISPDAKNARLLVMAPPRLQQQIANEVQNLIPRRSSPAAPTQVRQAGVTFDTPAASVPLRMRLQGIGWGAFEDALQQVSGSRLPVTTSRNGELATFQLVDQPLTGTVIEVDRRENAVTVVAPEPALPGWRKMIGSLDATGAPAGAVTELVRLENAEPAPIQRAIRLLTGLERGDSAAVAAAPAVGNQRVPRLLAANFPQQDAQPGDAAAQPAPQATPPAADEGGAGLIGDTQIQFVPELGIIIVRGAKRDVERVMEVIRQIEEQSAITQPDVEVYPLQYVNSQAVEELLDELYAETLAARQGEISITALDKPNAVLLIGRKEALATVKDLLAEIDQPVPPTSQLRVFRLEYASAVDAETTVRGFFVNLPGSDEELRPGLGTRVRVIADYRTNSLIVQASPRDMLEVTRLVEQLDVQEIPAQSQLKVFRLNHALAEDLAPTLQDAITGAPEAEGDAQVTSPSTTLSILSVDAEGGRVLDSGILAGAFITSDPNANAIVVRAPSTSMPLIAELIRQLDQPPGIESLVKVFTIENGDAMQLVSALQQLFGTETTTQGVGAANVLGLAPTTATPESSLVPLRFAADMRTNSIIASGSANDLEVVESLMLRLDTEGFATRITEVIWLRNQAAEPIALALQEFVQRRQQAIVNIQQFQQGLGPFDALERDLVVVPQFDTNSLLISVAPRLYDTVRRMIDQLDRRPPMVLIKVLIAEVELNDGFEFGAELGIQDDLLFDRGIAGTASTPGFNFNNAGQPNLSSAGRDSLAERTVSTFGLGTSSGTFGYGGFVLSAASDSVSLLLRTLQDAGRLQILSRPQLMTKDNTEGLVQVGSQVPRISAVSSTTIGGQTFSTVDIPVGLILRVRPRVGSDGLIVMDVDATRSAIDTVSQGIPVGFSPTGDPIFSPIINETTAQSTITAFSGQTVVYGGLIQKSRSQRSRRIPYISNIPVLGNFFRFDQEIESRSELLVVLTPMIVSGEEDLEYVKATETARMSWCLADVVEMHGDEGLGGGHGLWGPAISPVIYPDLQPTVDDFAPIHVPGDMSLDMHQPDGTACPPSVLEPTPQVAPSIPPTGPYATPDAPYSMQNDPYVPQELPQGIYVPQQVPQGTYVPQNVPPGTYAQPPSVRRQPTPPALDDELYRSDSVLQGPAATVDQAAPIQPMNYTAPARMPRVRP